VIGGLGSQFALGHPYWMNDVGVPESIRKLYVLQQQQHQQNSHLMALCLGLPE